MYFWEFCLIKQQKKIEYGCIFAVFTEHVIPVLCAHVSICSSPYAEFFKIIMFLDSAPLQPVQQ